MGMGIRMAFLVAMAVAAVVLAVTASSPRAEPAISSRPHLVASMTRRPPGARCQKPRALRLVRFEDGSAQLRCGPRILFRVTVPG
jgi:hypothetical protein